MINKSQKLMDKTNDLATQLEIAKMETIKYANKFLEVEEKWIFINKFLKDLNSIRNKEELCNKICNEFFNLTNSFCCTCTFFNQEINEIEHKKFYCKDNECAKKKNKSILTQIEEECSKFFENEHNIVSLSITLDSMSNDKHIILPIIYNQNLLGYLSLENDSSSFFKENIGFVKIITEHIALILENISLYEESEKGNRRKIEFLSGISHEFKTPLNSIIGFSEILKTNDLTPIQFRYIDNISQSSKHLLTLIEDVLDVSKSQYKLLELKYEEFKPNEEILKIISILDEMIKEKNIEMKYTLTNLSIIADIKRFRQLIYNLVSNAIKFNKEFGKITIITYLENDSFVFVINDTGDGIKKKDHDKIFEFFSQVNDSQLKRQLGSGVGLALCKKIIDAHKGEISFNSQIKKGSCFWFSLPIKGTKKED